MTVDHLTDLVDDVLGRVGDAEAIVRGTSTRGGLTRFANSFIHQHVGDDTTTVELKLALDGRVATASSSDVSATGLDALVRRTRALAELRPVDPDWPGLADPSEVPDVSHVDPATAVVEPQQRAEMVRAFVDAGDGLLAAGYVDSESTQYAVGNTAGQRLRGDATRATVDGIHQTPTSAGSAHQTSVALADLDAAEAGRLAARRARDSADAVDLEPGRYPVVLSPEAAATIAVFVGFYGFNAKNVLEEQSPISVGETPFDEALVLRDDVRDPRSLGVPFDVEGTPKQSIDLVRDGAARALVHDRRTAGRMGTTSTGHAVPGGDTFGPVPTNLIVGAGTQSVDELVASLDRGLLVTSFNYCRVLDPKTLVVTGLTRNGTFLVENGEVTGAVGNLRFTQSFIDALAPGALGGIGDDARLADSEFGPGIVVAPSLRLASWNFTGGAKG